jgi:prepilin-type N-terminal cleavage/methylation domain-containing protein/prepilin-type processing-associated H-X9-DG protein
MRNEVMHGSLMLMFSLARSPSATVRYRSDRLLISSPGTCRRPTVGARRLIGFDAEAIVSRSERVRNGGADFTCPADGSSPPGFTLVELLMVVGIVSLLVAILMPALAGARAAAHTAACANNIRQIGLATFTYASRHGGRLPILAVQPDGTGALPASAIWGTTNQIYLDFTQGTLIGDLGGPAVAERIFKCPDDVDSSNFLINVTLVGDQDHPWQVVGRDFKSTPRNFSYNWNSLAYVFQPRPLPGYYQGLQLARIRQPAQKLLLFENGGDARELPSQPMIYDETSYAEKCHLFIGMRHHNRSNAFYADGHVELFESRSLKDESVARISDNLVWIRHFKLDEE